MHFIVAREGVGCSFEYESPERSAAVSARPAAARSAGRWADYALQLPRTQPRSSVYKIGVNIMGAVRGLPPVQAMTWHSAQVVRSRLA